MVLHLKIQIRIRFTALLWPYGSLLCVFADRLKRIEVYPHIGVNLKRNFESALKMHVWRSSRLKMDLIQKKDCCFEDCSTFQPSSQKAVIMFLTLQTCLPPHISITKRENKVLKGAMQIEIRRFLGMTNSSLFKMDNRFVG